MTADMKSNLPSFSLVLETVNLELADIDDVRRSLESVAGQDLSPEAANEVIMVESGEVPPIALGSLEAQFPWLRIIKVPRDTGYEEAKMAGVARTTGEVIVFFDADCIYEPGWLRGLVQGIAERTEFAVIGGETMIHTDNVWNLASAVLFSFEWYTGANSVYESERFHFNNVAFRRVVLENVPPPVHLPVFRLPTTYYAALLREKSYFIGRQPASRARHEAPNGPAHFFWRYLVFGLDAVNTQKLAWPKKDTADGTLVSRAFLLTQLARIGIGHTKKVSRRLVRLVREAPARLLYLPLVLPLVIGGGLLMVGGFLSGLLAPKFLPNVMPASIKRGTPYAKSAAS